MPLPIMVSSEAVTPYRGSFHFVNKDASNLNKRNAEEAFSISSHVTNKYYRWAKVNRSRGGREGYSNPSSCDVSRRRSAEDKPPSMVDTDSCRSSFSDEVSHRTICWQLGSGANADSESNGNTPSSTESSGLINESIIPENEHDDVYTNSQCLAETVSSTLSNRIDWNGAPDWGACPIFQKEALDIYRNFFLSYSYTNSGGPLCRQATEAAWQRRAKDLVSDKKCLHGWYGSVLMLKAHYMQTEQWTLLFPMALNHQNRSLTLIREHIQQDMRPSESLVMCIFYISAMGFYSGDIDSNKEHGRALWRFVDDLGGLDALTPDTRSHVLLADNANSRFTLTRPHLDFSRWDPGSFQDQPEFAEYGSLLSESEYQYHRWDDAFLLVDDDISERLSTYVAMHREFMAAHLLAVKLMQAKEEHAGQTILGWLHGRRPALSSWTMVLFSDIKESFTPQTRLSRAVRRQLQACICLGVSYAMSFAYGFSMPLHKWLLYIPIHQLRPQIEILLEFMVKRGSVSTTSTTHLSHHEPLLFLFFVGACAEQVSDDAGKRPALLADRRWHSARFAEVSHLLGLRTWREAQRILKRFIYKEDVMDRFVEGLFEQRADLLRFGSLLGES